MYNNAKYLFNKLLSIYYIDYINIRDEERETMSEKYNPSMYLLKVINLLVWRKKIKKKVNHSWRKLLLKE